MSGVKLTPSNEVRAQVALMVKMMTDMVEAFAPENDFDYERTWKAISEWAKLDGNVRAATLFEQIWVRYEDQLQLRTSHLEAGSTGEAVQVADVPDAEERVPHGAGEADAAPTGDAAGGEADGQQRECATVTAI